MTTVANNLERGRSQCTGYRVELLQQSSLTDQAENNKKADAVISRLEQNVLETKAVAVGGTERAVQLQKKNDNDSQSCGSQGSRSRSLSPASSHSSAPNSPVTGGMVAPSKAATAELNPFFNSQAIQAMDPRADMVSRKEVESWIVEMATADPSFRRTLMTMYHANPPKVKSSK